VLVALAVFALVLYKWRYVSLASITAASVIPIVVGLAEGKPELTLMAVAIAFIVIFRHRENISRLKSGTELKFKA
jgi:acyl phosphate:glycerol-3-phosphate acyltransferase